MHLVGVNMFTAPTIGWESRACLCQTVVSHAALQLPAQQYLRGRAARPCRCCKHCWGLQGNWVVLFSPSGGPVRAAQGGVGCEGNAL